MRDGSTNSCFLFKWQKRVLPDLKLDASMRVVFHDLKRYTVYRQFSVSPLNAKIESDQSMTMYIIRLILLYLKIFYKINTLCLNYVSRDCDRAAHCPSLWLSLLLVVGP